MAVAALGLALPALPAAAETTTCGLCGCPIYKGKTPARRFAMSAEFGAFEHLHPDRSELICSSCVVATSATTGLMNRFSRAIFTAGTAYRLENAEDISWMLLQAEPPFVAVFNMRASAHVLWQTPVTLDRRRISIGLGNVVGTVRPVAVLAARCALGRLAEWSNAVLGAQYQWPVINLSLYDDATDICRLMPSHERVLRASEETVVMADLALFDDLNQVERWALAALLLARPKRALLLTDLPRPPILHLPRTQKHK